MSFFSIVSPLEREELVKNKDNLVRKILASDRTEKKGIQDTEKKNVEMLGPITKKIDELISSSIITKEKEKIKFFNFAGKRVESHPLGIRLNIDNKPYIGDKEVFLDNMGNIQIGDDVIPLTSGLQELLTLKKPTDYSIEELATYRKILLDTNAIYEDNIREKGPLKSKTFKWNNFGKNIYGDLSTESKTLTPRQVKILSESLIDIVKAKLYRGKSEEMNKIVDELYFKGEMSDSDYKTNRDIIFLTYENEKKIFSY